MSDHATTNRLIIDRVLQGDGVDLSLPSKDLEILDTLSGPMLRVNLSSDQPGSSFLRDLAVGEPLIIAIRDALGQRLFRAVKVCEKTGARTDSSPAQFAFSLTG